MSIEIQLAKKQESYFVIKQNEQVSTACEKMQVIVAQNEKIAKNCHDNSFFTIF